ncbi:MAG: hypothetical protein HQL08_14415 [Nitrospirae bacterium]|nr:hypothetical protein [Nitrospirota bacterium]
MRKANLLWVIIFIIFPSAGLCEVKCIDTEAEAIILNNDTPSAKAEATARAKWDAVEQTAGVEVKAQSVVQNMALVDEAVSKQIKGVVTGFKVLREEKRKDTVWVKVNACVEPLKAKEAVSSLALNNSIAVFIYGRKPKNDVNTRESGNSTSTKEMKHISRSKEEYDEMNILSETINGRLAEQGFTVMEIAPTHAVDAREIENSIKSNNFLTLRSLIYKFLSNVLLLGKVDYTTSTKKGEDIGYGLSMPFNNVTVRLAYRIVAKNSSGKMVVLAAGNEEGKGMASNIEDATARGLKDLSNKVTPTILAEVGQYIKGVAKKIAVKVDGISDIASSFEVKEILQNIAWVTNVEEEGLGQFVVSYQENTVYLANSIAQKNNMKITNFSPRSVQVSYQKP